MSILLEESSGDEGAIMVSVINLRYSQTRRGGKHVRACLNLPFLPPSFSHSLVPFYLTLLPSSCLISGSMKQWPVAYTYRRGEGGKVSTRNTPGGN